jgi:hypothetical protein
MVTVNSPPRLVPFPGGADARPCRLARLRDGGRLCRHGRKGRVDPVCISRSLLVGRLWPTSPSWSAAPATEPHGSFDSWPSSWPSSCPCLWSGSARLRRPPTPLPADSHAAPMRSREGGLQPWAPPAAGAGRLGVASASVGRRRACGREWCPGCVRGCGRPHFF